jgi:glycosyltransferase involved in cell wall biosynthesis
MASAKPLISVVITCFNYEHYVAGAIECVLDQGYLNKELVVVNDGSSDGSIQVIERYAGQLRIIDQVNQGSIAAYNQGFAAASGEIVIFLDADDLLAPDALSRIAAAWSPACAKVQYDLTIIDGKGRDLGRKFCNFDESYDAARVRESFQRTGTYRWPVTVGNAYSRWFASKIFPLTVAHGPDGTLNTLAPVYGEVRTIAAPLGSYRLHDNNLWASGGWDLARLPRRIEHRMKEVLVMEQHARRLGVPLPRGNALDHEIAFLNYRLMAKKLHFAYAGHEQDTPYRLLGKAYRLVRAEKYPLKLSVAHCLWFAVLCVSPKAVARELIQLRFKRHTVGESYRKAWSRLLRRTDHARPGRSAVDRRDVEFDEAGLSVLPKKMPSSAAPPPARHAERALL